MLNNALEGEMDSHLKGGEQEFDNRCNGHKSKHVQTSMGDNYQHTVLQGRDLQLHDGRKREKILVDSLADSINRSICHREQYEENSDILEV